MSDAQDDVRIAAQQVDRAQALMEMGRHEQAIPLLAKALASTPDDDWLHCRMADAYYTIGDYEKSNDFARSALHLNPNSDHAHFRLAWLHLEAKHFDGALKHARAAIKIDPDDGANLYTLAWCEYHSGHYKQALKAAERAIELDPDNSGLHGLIADLSFNMGKPKQAEVHYREALRHDPENADIHCHLGQALAEQHKVHEAAEHLLAAVKIDPSNEDYRDKLFAIVHHDLADLSGSARVQALQELGPAVQHFYEDQLAQRGWFGKLRLTSLVTLWLFALALMMLFFTWVTGEDTRQLILFTVVVAGVYSILFIMRTGLKLVKLYKYRSWKKAGDS